MTIPIASIATSRTVPERPSTKLWWYSSTIAYANAIAAAIGSARRASGRSAQNHSNAREPNATAWAILRRIRSSAPSPESRSCCAESTKISAIRASGAGARLALIAIRLTGRIVVR